MELRGSTPPFLADDSDEDTLPTLKVCAVPSTLLSFLPHSLLLLIIFLPPLPLSFSQVTWKVKKSDATNGGYSQQLLEDTFSQVCQQSTILIP